MQGLAQKGHYFFHREDRAKVFNGRIFVRLRRLHRCDGVGVPHSRQGAAVSRHKIEGWSEDDGLQEMG